MAIFRTKSSSSSNSGHHEKISDKEYSQYKVHTANLHDPILSAINESQPFEQAANTGGERRQSYLSQEGQNYKDVFGQPIGQPDISNPSRGRNERPLDTIRGFEYAITGDMQYREQLESNRLGWGFHEDFPYYNLQREHQDNALPSMAPPAAQFGGDDQAVYQAGNYSATSLKNDSGKKQKRGLFGRKKK